MKQVKQINLNALISKVMQSRGDGITLSRAASIPAETSSGPIGQEFHQVFGLLSWDRVRSKEDCRRQFCRIACGIPSGAVLRFEEAYHASVQEALAWPDKDQADHLRPILQRWVEAWQP